MFKGVYWGISEEPLKGGRVVGGGKGGKGGKGGGGGKGGEEAAQLTAALQYTE